MGRFTNGEVAVVTGGAHGIGAATCRKLAAEGATVVVADVDAGGAAAVAAEIGEQASAIHVDIEDVASIEQLIATTIERHGRIDILDNNAALLTAELRTGDVAVADLDLDAWDRTLAGNLRGSAAACKFALPHMVARGGGAIVNTTSVQGLAGDVVRSAYGASKAGVIALTQYVATQYGVHGVRCNAVAPGLILTERIRRDAPAEFLDGILPHIMLDRFGTPEDVANLVCFLASDEASFITGQVYACDGGLRTHLPNSIGGAPAPEGHDARRSD